MAKVPLIVSFFVRRDSDSPYLGVKFGRNISGESEEINRKLSSVAKKGKSAINEFDYVSDRELWVDGKSESWKRDIPKMRGEVVSVLREIFGRLEVRIEKEMWMPIPGQKVTIVTRPLVEFLFGEEKGTTTKVGPWVDLKFAPPLPEDRMLAFLFDFSEYFYVGESDGFDPKVFSFNKGGGVAWSRLRSDIVRVAKKYLGPDVVILHEEEEADYVEEREPCLGEQVWGENWENEVALTEEERLALSY